LVWRKANGSRTRRAVVGMGSTLPCDRGCRKAKSAPACRATDGSVHVLAAVDTQGRAGDEPRVLGAQERDASGDFIRVPEAADRDPGDDLLEYVLRHRRHHVGVDITRRDGVDRNAVTRAFLRQRLGEAVDPAFGRSIVDLAVLAGLAV